MSSRSTVRVKCVCRQAIRRRLSPEQPMFAPVPVDPRAGRRHGRDPVRDRRTHHHLRRLLPCTYLARCTPTRIRPCVRAQWRLNGRHRPRNVFGRRHHPPSGRVRSPASTCSMCGCRDDSDCHFAAHGNPITAFHNLISALDHETLPAKVHGEERTLGPGEANIGIAMALYAGRGRDGWDELGLALRDAATGTGSRLLALGGHLHRPATGRSLRRDDRRVLRHRLSGCTRAGNRRREHGLPCAPSGRPAFARVERVAQPSRARSGSAQPDGKAGRAMPGRAPRCS